MSDDHVTVASNVLGTIGTVLWCIQLIPQIWYNWKRKKTDGFPATMMFLWASCSVPMGAYLILQIQPQIFGFFSLVSWAQVLYYGHKGITWPDLVVGIVAAVLLSAGLLPPYFELWKRDGRVIGFSPAAQGTFDLLGGIMYILVVVLEAGIYISHIVWRIRYRKLRKEARESGKSIDDLLAAPSQRDNAGETRDLEAGLFDYDGSKEFEQGSTRVQSPTVPCVEQSQVAGEKC
ncbi:uncharacterized protein N7469_002629 [Penicillium citrinum]|uniref:PQ loop repeat protein n=2 Tax=Penicillium TaxID=5073 RepID=A0A9W9PAQ3_PENCI|nr:uncharacterized protein N7469_002629 [Penicillium citrinum]KAJ5241038.1 hypothetical protein N7469_002629 [Penicillium citrinum]KAJ5586034.1 hypothetical protein N7450_005821 [Penicillium hetheringtonii]